MTTPPAKPFISRNADDKVSVHFPALHDRSLMCELAKIPGVLPKCEHLVARHESLTFGELSDRIRSANSQRDPQQDEVAEFLRDLHVKLKDDATKLASEGEQ
jgi:uncharacterized protein YdcH (DUF465 family)